MASGHVNRIKRPDTWLHRPMLQNVKKVLANPEPSTHDPLRKSATGSGSGSGRLVVEIVGGVTEVSLHVRYGGISGPRSAPYQTDV